MKISRYVNANLLFLAGFLLYSLIGTAKSNRITAGDETATITAQPVELSVSKYSDAPHTDLVHWYVLKAVNTSDQPISLKIKAGNTDCEKKKSVNLEQEVYWTEQGGAGSLTNISISTNVPAHGTVEFNIKINRPLNTSLNSWNCTEIKAVGAADQILSNTVMIETFIPDPKDFK